jgi:diguanylate cyclase (GGDEF)-like protein
MPAARFIKGLRLGRVTVAAAAVLMVLFTLGGVAVTNEALRIGSLAEESRVRIVPMILERQRAVINLEKLKQYGTTVMISGEPRVREDTLVLVTFLINHPSLQFDPALSQTVHRAEQVIGALAAAREKGEAKREQGDRAGADEVERQAKADWRDMYGALEAMSDALSVSATNLTSERAAAVEEAAAQVKRMVRAALLVLALALCGAALFIHQLLLRPILLTTAALDIGRPHKDVRLPTSAIGEIDLLYRSVERMATAFSEIEEAHRQARTAQAELRRLASTDELTGVANRRWFTSMARRELERCRRYGHPLALLMIDVDHFKRVNDNYGHAVGDEVLKTFARVLEGSLRSVDLLGRMGGEEFAVVLPETNPTAAANTAERLRAAVEALAFPLEDGTALCLTASVGIGVASPEGETLDSLLARADEGLYAAKRGGRNRVIVG